MRRNNLVDKKVSFKEDNEDIWSKPIDFNKPKVIK